MNINELEILLKSQSEQIFTVPQDLDFSTQEKMQAVNQNRKPFFLNLILITLCLLLSVLVIILLLPNIYDLLQKMIVLFVNINFMSLIILLYLLNYKINYKQEVIL